MRTTVRIEADLLQDLKARARRENTSLTRLLNRTLRAGLRKSRTPSRGKPYREKTHDMGAPHIDLRKALAVAAELEDEEALRKLSLRK